MEVDNHTWIFDHQSWYTKIHISIIKIHNSYTNSKNLFRNNRIILIITMVILPPWKFIILHNLKQHMSSHQWAFFTYELSSRSFQVWCHSLIKCSCWVLLVYIIQIWQVLPWSCHSSTFWIGNWFQNLTDNYEGPIKTKHISWYTKLNIYHYSKYNDFDYVFHQTVPCVFLRDKMINDYWYYSAEMTYTICRNKHVWVKPALRFMVWIDNYIHIKAWCLIINLCHFSGRLA